MGLLNATFGETGTAQAFFGGEWWLVGLLLIMVLLLYFYGRGVSGDGLIVFIFSAILLVTLDNLFRITNDIVMTIVIFILIFVGLILVRAIGLR